MTISKAKALINELNPDPNKVRRIIECLRWESSYVQECMDKGSRDLESGEEVRAEISSLISQLETKL